MNKIFFILFLFSLPSFCLTAQDAKISENLFSAGKKKNNPDSSIHYDLLAIQAAGTDTENTVIAKICNDLGMIYAQRKFDYAHALYYFQKVMDIGIKMNDNELVSKADINFANIYLSQGKYESAIAHYLRALKTVELSGDTLLITTNYLCIAAAYYYLKDYTESLSYYEKSLAIFQKKNDQGKMAYCFNTMGVIYKEKGDYTKALQLLTQTTRIAAATKDSTILPSGLNSLGDLYAKTGQYEKALECLLEGISILEKQGNQKEIADAQIILGNIYLKQDQDGLALKTFLLALNTANRIGVNDIKKGAYLGLADTYIAMGDFKNAVDNLELFASIKDSLYNENSSRQIADMQTKYNSEQKEAENILLARQNKIKSLKIEKQATQRNFLILSIALLLLISALVFNRFRLKQQNQLLEEKELRSRAVFLAHEQEKLRISSELHDGLGPLLSLIKMNISGLEKPGDEKMLKTAAEIKELVSTGIHEVRAISNSLVPSLLGKQGLQAALMDFVEQVNLSGQVRVDFQSAFSVSLGPEAEINIYRIVQEAVNNILKHSGAETTQIKIEENNRTLEVSIHDNGKGFSADDLAAIKGNGLNNIYSRADFLKAELKIKSKPGQGTLLSLSIPI